MKKLILILLLLVFCTGATPPKQAIVLAGQSNMGKSAENIRLLMTDYLVINCAVGGTSITTWQPGEVQYENCLAKVKNIQNDGYIIKGIFWYQGERDTPNYEIARRWKRLFYRFVNNFRRDTDTNAPVVFAQLGPKPTQPGRIYWQRIKNMQRLSADDNKMLYMITTSDIKPYCPMDAVHFCADGYIEISHRFMDKFMEVVK